MQFAIYQTMMFTSEAWIISSSKDVTEVFVWNNPMNKEGTY